MNTENKQEIYASPAVTVVEIKTWRVMCASPLDTEQNGSDSDPEDLNW